MTALGPLDRARLEWQVARSLQEDKDTPAHRERVELALVHLDYLLDTLPLLSSNPSPSTPGTPGASHPGVPVSSTAHDTLPCAMAPYKEGECDSSTTAQHSTGNEDG